MPQAIGDEILEEDHRESELQLSSLRFYSLRKICPTSAGILLFGDNPLFFLPGAYIQLKPADGAIGAHAQAVRDCYHDFWELAEKIAEVAEVTKSGSLSPDEPVQTTLFEL